MNNNTPGWRDILRPHRLLWILLPISLSFNPAIAFEASFDCAKAASTVEKLICADPGLAATDREMEKIYHRLWQAKPDILQSQRQWLRGRNACENAECIRSQYEIRLHEFSEILRGLAVQISRTAPPAVPIPPPAKPALSPEIPSSSVQALHQARPGPEVSPPPVPAPEATVPVWEKLKTVLHDFAAYLFLGTLAALGFVMKRSPRIREGLGPYYGLVIRSGVYKAAQRAGQGVQGRLESLDMRKPMAALFGVLAVLGLSYLVTRGFNAMVSHLMAQGYDMLAQYGWETFFARIRDLVTLLLLASTLFWLARIPFCLGVWLGLAWDVSHGFSFPDDVVPTGLDAALIAYVGLYQREIVLAWLRKWRRRKKTLYKFLGGVIGLGMVSWIGQFAAAQLGSWAEPLVWIVAAILFFIWIGKEQLPPETFLFDATLEPDKYFKNDGPVLGWSYCNIPEPSPKEDEDFLPYQKAAHVVRYRTDKHFLSIMPNRSGKGRSQIIPNLLQLADWSCWVVDPKGENALVTAPWRKAQGHEIVIFNPYGLWADEFKARGFDTFQTFNPLLNLDPTSHRFIGDVDALADALVYNTGGDSHWSEGARGLVALLIMYLVTEPTEKPTFRRLRELIAGGYDSLIEAFGMMRENPFDLVRENVGRYDKLSKETEGLIATAETQTGIFRNKTLCKALEGSAFDFEAMKHRKMTVYMILPAEYLVTQARFLRLILLSAMAQFTRSEEGRHRIMVLLDEFANLGPLQMVEQGAALISGYGVTLWPFVQNLSQLQKLYPNNWEVFIANAAAITVANVNDVTTAEYFSKRAGKTIKHLWSWSSSSSSTSGEKPSSTSGSSRSKSESIQDILPVEDIYNLAGGAEYVFFEGKVPPLIALKSNYDYPHLPWQGRAAVNPMVKAWR